MLPSFVVPILSFNGLNVVVLSGFKRVVVIFNFRNCNA
jgi:hypothetical protein